jgi:hypothetical protein
MTIPVLVPEQHWTCPSCDFTDVTRIAGHVSHLHPCKGQRLLMVPMVPAGTKSVHVVRDPDDYVGGTLIRTDAEGRPVSHVNVIRDDGMDAVVYPVAAVITREELEELHRV